MTACFPWWVGTHNSFTFADSDSWLNVEVWLVDIEDNWYSDVLAISFGSIDHIHFIAFWIRAPQPPIEVISRVLSFSDSFRLFLVSAPYNRRSTVATWLTFVQHFHFLHDLTVSGFHQESRSTTAVAGLCGPGMRILSSGVILNNIYLEDCLTGMTKIESGSVNFICTDLPFGSTQNRWDCPIDLDLLWAQYKRIIKKNGAVCLFAQVPFSMKLGASNLPWLKYEWIWEKQQGTGFLNANRFPLKSHENILVFCEGAHTYNPQMEPGKPYFTRSHSQSTNYNFCERSPTDNKGTRYPKSVLNFQYDKGGFHPTQKPLLLAEYLVRTYTNPGETVLDSCSGSGVVPVACLNTGRNFIGFETDETYYRKSLERIDTAKAAIDRPDLLTSLFAAN